MSERLEDIAAAIVANGKGLLAADESSGTIKKRFDVIGVESTADSRRDYREMMFRARDAMTKYISGVILYDETIRQKAADGTPLVDIIKASGAIPGIKVDAGAKPLAGFPGDTITEGLDGLRERLADYYKLGARFAKWRAVIDIDTGKGVPSATSIGSNTHALARYAALCQEAGIVPIVEPEVLMDGAHDIDTCFEVSRATLTRLYDELYAARVVLEGTILKPNMVLSGKKSGKVDRPEQVAVPGIAFLSGGQEDEEATANLNAINAIGPHPWKLTFSYGRALQAAPQKAWSGKASNVAAGQAAFTHRAHMNYLAALGKWQPALEKAA
ncbi:fructose-bisphosphate aldolase class I [Mesorhizobium sp. M00.F.Ca.ET.186.01.1.1]|nr:fructose-bisphosphate aldolase class I [bacterium M00.F.Ca.ET.205.01.1.1]TGU51940.1 fructose-bisphosphate aldolase class I [bacterium M00.F.Ca.ET.152.01.1.1]TGV33336.1 fructose-bisphosphate aldolase class I [Mesorhizobium sp. M00.F.Ca.ET.186.01.1.1]TGZ42479.1 fructose-bisphosphate aldolase class I [bacterium M00.F.Ca.ET.162.01.1.1]